MEGRLMRVCEMTGVKFISFRSDATQTMLTCWTQPTLYVFAVWNGPHDEHELFGKCCAAISQWASGTAPRGLLVSRS